MSLWWIFKNKIDINKNNIDFKIAKKEAYKIYFDEKLIKIYNRNK